MQYVARRGSILVAAILGLGALSVMVGCSGETDEILSNVVDGVMIRRPAL